MMDSWSYVSEGKGFAFGEANCSPDSYSRSKNALNPSYYDNNIQFFSENYHLGLGELGFSKLIRNSMEDVLFNKDGNESSSKHSSSIVESNTRDSFSSLIDLNLGRFVDHRSVNQNFKSSAESSMPVKRFRSTSMNARNNCFCQVHGCNKDLSGSKDYHKRHRVCEAHSKTAKVTVNGIEQRFCQQCSRFHLLDEFDDGKRSCRKRLAGHNERRRKPQIGIHSGRNGRLLQSYNGLPGSMINDPTVTAGSFIYPYVLSKDFLHPEEHETNDWRKRIKLEDRMDFGPPLAIPITNKNLHSKPNYPHLHEDQARSIFSENSSRFPPEPSGLNYGSRSLIQDSSFGNEDLVDYDTALSTTGCALSLLSSELHDVDQAHGHYSNTIGVCEDLMGVSSQASFNGISNQLRSSRKNSEEGNNLNPILVSDGCNDSTNFDITDLSFKGWEIVNCKDRLFCEDGPSPTIDLLQLSSQLQRVEHQRQSMQGKPGNDAFCCLRIT